MRFKDCSVMVFIQSHCCTSWHFKILRKLSPLNLCLESLYSISSISEHSLMAYFIFDEAAICMQVFCSPNFPFLWFQNKWATLFSFLLVLIQQMYTTSNVIVFAEEKIQKLHFSTAVQYFLKNACHWPAEPDFYSTCSNIWLKEMWKPEYFVTSAHRINFSSYKKIVSKSEEYSLFLCQRILCSVQLKSFFSSCFVPLQCHLPALLRSSQGTDRSDVLFKPKDLGEAVLRSGTSVDCVNVCWCMWEGGC